MKRMFLALLLLLFLLALPVNWLLARHNAPQPWPADIADYHSALAANMDLADLAAMDAQARTERFRQAREDGIDIVRLRIPWALIQPQPDVWEWQAFEQIVRHNAFGFMFVLVLDGTPAWARAPEDAQNPWAPPRDIRDFGTFAAEVARRAPWSVDASGRGQVLAYQIWDEPNIGPHWGAHYADPQGYLALLREARHSIHAVRPAARIMLAALAPTTTDDGFNMPEPRYLHHLLSLGAGAFFDIAAGQAYGFDQPPESPPAPDQLNFRRVELLHQVLVRHGLAGMPIFITRWGWWTPQSPNLDPQVSPWRSIPVTTLRDYQQRGWLWMQMHWPWAAAPAWVQYAPGPEDATIHLGWVQRDAAGSPTPAGAGLAALARQVLVPGAGRLTPERAVPADTVPLTWRFSADAADPTGAGSELTLTFSGRAVALLVQQGPYKGHFEVWIDHVPAPALPIDPATGHAYLTLYDPANRITLFPLARNLTEGEHVLHIRAQGGWGHWPLRRIVIDDKPHGQPWPFWPINTMLVIALARVLWQIFQSQNMNQQDERGERRGGVLLGRFAAWLPAAALVALPWVQHPVHLGPVGLPLHELLIWLGLAAAAGAWLLGARPLRSPSVSRMDAALLLLLVIGFFAALDARYRGYAFYDWRVTFLTPAIFYWLITRFTLRRARGAPLLGRAALLAGVLVSIIALVQVVLGRAGMAEGVPRARALYGSANNLALVLGRLLPLILVLTFVRRHDAPDAHGDGFPHFFERWASCRLCTFVVYGVVLALMAAAGFLTFSKGLLFISVPVGMLMLAIYRPKLRKPILALAVLGVLALLPFLNTPRLAQITSGTGRFRLYLWQSAWRMWLDHPWLGVGPDNFLYAYRSFYALPAAWEELNLSHPHNLFFDLLTRVGLFGFLAAMALLGQAMWKGQKLLRGRLGPEHPLHPWLLGLWAGLVAGLAHGMIDNSIFLPDLMILTLLAAAVIQAL
jgi:O-antigen ligase